MFKEDITKCFYFGAKVKFIKKDDMPVYLINDTFCLLGFNETTYTLTKYINKGTIDIHILTGNIYADLELAD